MMPMTIEDATTCCHLNDLEVLLEYAHIENAGEDCIPINANMYVMHIIPVHPPPMDWELDETNCMLPGNATLDENPSLVRFSPDEMSFRTISANAAVKPSHPPE